MTTEPIREEQAKTIAGLSIRYDEDNAHYSVVVDVSQFARGYHCNDMFLVWLMARSPSETVEFTFVRTDCPGSCPEGYITFLNLIRACSATTIARVDHIHEGVCSWAAISCDRMAVSDFGLLQFSPITSRDGSTGTLAAQIRVCADYIDYLYDQAIEHGWMTSEEKRLLAGGSVVFLTPDTLKSRVS